MSTKNKNYIPARADIIWIDFNPQIGKEIMKRRPALVLSPYDYNKHGLILAIPITNQIKGYPFEVLVETSKITGVALADSIKNLDWRFRNAEYISSSPQSLIFEVLKLLSLLLKP